MSERDWHVGLVTGPVRPTSVKVGSTEWRISYDAQDMRRHQASADVNFSLGHTFPMFAEIVLATLGLPESHVRSTLLHEVLHAVWHTYGIDAQDTVRADREEALIWRLEAPLLSLLRDNPTLLAYLVAA